MKPLRYAAALLALLALAGLSSCSASARIQTHPHQSGKLPPGQVKKATGSQSAAPYVPGHRRHR